LDEDTFLHLSEVQGNVHLLVTLTVVVTPCTKGRNAEGVMTLTVHDSLLFYGYSVFPEKPISASENS